MLHFAAKYGLKNMCSMLLNCPGAYQAISTRNCNGDTPSELAAKHGDQDLKDHLDNYLVSVVVHDKLLTSIKYCKIL